MMPFQAMRLRKPDAAALPLLDLYGSAAAAYSTARKLRAAYSGPCLRVRNTSTNIETDIGFDANGNVDTAAILAAAPVTGKITKVYDQSGNGIDLAQATAAAQPGSNTGGVLNNSFNGRLAFNADGDDALVSGFSIDLATPRKVSISSVHRSQTSGPASAGIWVLQRSAAYDFASAAMLERRTTNLSLTLGNGTTAAFNTNQYQQTQTADSNLSTMQVVQVFVDGIGGTRSMYVDGTLKTLAAVSGTLATSGYLSTGTGNHRVIWGARSQNQTNTTSDYWNGSAAELVIWTADRSADRAGIKGNQSAYYGTP